MDSIFASRERNEREWPDLVLPISSHLITINHSDRIKQEQRSKIVVFDSFVR